MGSMIEIRDQASRVPIVVLTGMDDETMASWTLEEGAQDYLIKGQTDRESLVRCIRHAIQRHRTQSGKLRTAPARFAYRSPKTGGTRLFDRMPAAHEVT